LEMLPSPPRLPDAPALASDFQHGSRRHATITEVMGEREQVNSLMLTTTYKRQPNVYDRSATWGSVPRGAQ